MGKSKKMKNYKPKQTDGEYESNIRAFNLKEPRNYNSKSFLCPTEK